MNYQRCSNMQNHYYSANISVVGNKLERFRQCYLINTKKKTLRILITNLFCPSSSLYTASNQSNELPKELNLSLQSKDDNLAGDHLQLNSTEFITCITKRKLGKSEAAVVGSDL